MWQERGPPEQRWHDQQARHLHRRREVAVVRSPVRVRLRLGPAEAIRVKGQPSWRWLWIVAVTVAMALVARELAGWTGWWILVSGLAFGYFVAATEK